MKLKYLILILFVIYTNQLYSQEEVYPDNRYGYISIGSHFQMWRVKGYSQGFSQIVFPISLMMPFGNSFNISISHVPAMSWWYEDFKLFGLSDTWVQGNYIFLKNRLMVNVGVGLPTGKTRLNNTEYYISKLWLRRSLLRFSLPVYGQGFCTKGGFALAWPIRDQIVIGLGGQYVYHAAFHPVEYEYSIQGITRVADKEYLPGDEASGYIGLDFQVGENLKIMVDGIYTYYWRDMFDRTEVFQAGHKFTFKLGVFYKMLDYFIWSNMIYRTKGRSALRQGLVFDDENFKLVGDQIEVYNKIKIVDMGEAELFFNVDGRVVLKNELDEGDGFVVGLGIGGNQNFQNGNILSFDLKYYLGSDASYNEIGGEDLITCLEMALSMLFRL